MKNVGVPETPLRSAPSTSSATRPAVPRRRSSSRKRSTSRPSSSACRSRSPGAQRVLVVQQQVVHLPERALRGRRLGRLGGELGVRVHVGQRQVAPDVADVAEVGQQLAHDRLGLAAVRALEVAVLDQGDRRVRRAADVVALGVHRHGQVDDRLGRAEQRADARALRQQRGRPGRPARSSAEAQHARRPARRASPRPAARP